MYLKDYEKLSELEVSKIIKERSIKSVKKSREKRITKPYKKVICINTMEVFNSIQEASIKHNAHGISHCCLGKRNSSGKLNGEKLHWMYYEDYLELKDDEKKNILKTFKDNSRTTSKIICLNTKEVFNSAKEAGSKYSISISRIYNCCHNRNKSVGKLNGEKLYWMHYKDYVKQSNI